MYPEAKQVRFGTAFEDARSGLKEGCLSAIQKRILQAHGLSEGSV